MKYAIIKLGGKQFKVQEGATVTVERQTEPLAIEVLSFSDDKGTVLGEPFVEGAVVKASITAQKRARKVRVARFKSKSRYRKANGHRQPMSVITIEEISMGGTKAKASKKAESTKLEKEAE